MVVETPNSVKPLCVWSSEGEAGVDGTADCGGVVSREYLGMRPPCGATRHAGALGHRLCAKSAARDVTGAREAARLPECNRFCTQVCGTMVQSVCQAGTEEANQVKFLVRTEDQSPKNKGFVRMHVMVYEPVGAPSEEFLRAIRPYR